MIRGIVYVALVSLLISGCVAPTPGVTPTPTATLMPTPVQTPAPSPTAVAPSPTAAPPVILAPSIKVLSYPGSVDGEANFTVRWEVSGGAPGDISHTAVHWGFKQGGENIADYPRLTPVQTGKTPQEFSAEIKAPSGGDLIYFRAHAIVDGKHVYSPEYRIAINPRYTGGGGGY